MCLKRRWLVKCRKVRYQLGNHYQHQNFQMTMIQARISKSETFFVKIRFLPNYLQFRLLTKNFGHFYTNFSPFFIQFSATLFFFVTRFFGQFLQSNFWTIFDKLFRHFSSSNFSSKFSGSFLPIVSVLFYQIFCHFFNQFYCFC